MRSNIISLLKTNVFFFILLTIIIFILYGKSINYEFVGPDEKTLIENNIEQFSNIKNIPYFFTTSCSLSKTSLYYRPVLTISFAIEAFFFGLNTKIYHFTNILLFIFAIYLMFVLLVKIKLDKTITKCVCALIAVHPIFTSTVVWVPARNDTLLAIFIFLSFIFFINYLNNRKVKDLLLYISFFSISLFTKESAVVFIILYLIFPYCFNYKITKKEIVKLFLPVFFVFIFYFFVRSISVPSINIKFYLQNIYQCCINFICGTTIYLNKFFIPLDIAIFLHNISISFFQICFDIFVLFTVFIIFYKAFVNKKIIFFSLAWFILTLSPTFLLQDYVYYNHRLFISIISVLIILIPTITFVLEKYYLYKKYFMIIYILIFLSLSFISYYIVSDEYKNKESYWILAYKEAPTWHVTSYENALIFLKHGNYEKYKEFMFNAYNLSKGDIHIFNIIPILIKEGQIDKVKEICFNILQDKDAKLFHKIGANTTLGNIYLEENNFSKAYKYLTTALQLDKMNINLQNKVKILENKINGN